MVRTGLKGLLKRPGKSKRVCVNKDLVKIVKQVNMARKNKGLKPLSFNKISKFIAIKINKGDKIIYDEFIKL